MSEKLIFVSCGQQTDEEISLGKAIKGLIDNTPGFRAYFADEVHDFDALASNIIDALQNCSGLIAILHDRGLVKKSDGRDWGHRSSVWVNQEIAMLAYRQRAEGASIPVLVFKEDIVELEGAMTQLIVNPLPLRTQDDVVAQVHGWLKSTHFPPGSEIRDEIFRENWSQLSTGSLHAIAALIDLGGENVKKTAVRQRLRQRYNYEKNDASRALQNALGEFINTDLVKLISNIHSGDELSVNPTWRWHVERALREER